MRFIETLCLVKTFTLFCFSVYFHCHSLCRGRDSLLLVAQLLAASDALFLCVPPLALALQITVSRLEEGFGGGGLSAV